MARERQDYRDNLEGILKFTGDIHTLKVNKVVEYTGLSFNTVKKYFHFNKLGFITAETLARELSGMEAGYDR